MARGALISDFTKWQADGKFFNLPFTSILLSSSVSLFFSLKIAGSTIFVGSSRAFRLQQSPKEVTVFSNLSKNTSITCLNSVGIVDGSCRHQFLFYSHFPVELCCTDTHTLTWGQHVANSGKYIEIGSIMSGTLVWHDTLRC